ncbi:CaiB/BaiF CoA transferase family protein [Chloroflexota bacterium]
MTHSLPLKGIKVLEFSQAIMGPICGRFLGDLGADVIKIEPLEGDFTRLTDEPGVDSATFMVSNLNKRSLALNLKTTKGLEIAYELIRHSDVIIQNFRPGVMEKFGLGYSRLSRLNPKSVYLSLSMYGESGPLAGERGGDVWAQAITGMVESQSSPDSPQLIGHPVVDTAGALTGALAVMAALLERERTGKGQQVSTNLVNVGVLLQWPAISNYLIEGNNFKGTGRGGVRWLFPHGAYTAKDGNVVIIHGQDNDEWNIVCSILSIEYLLENSRYDSPRKRDENKFELYPILDEAFRQKTRSEWDNLFRENNLRCDACLDYAELVSHPQFKTNELIINVEDPREGKIPMLANPINFGDNSSMISYRHAPFLGEHSKEILSELGFSERDIDDFSEQGIIGLPGSDILTSRRVRENTP